MSRQIKKLIQEIAKGKTQPITQSLFLAEVVSVENDSCTILINDLEVPEVRLRATLSDSENKLLMVPKVGSHVLVTSLNGDYSQLAISMINEAEHFVYQQNDLQISFDSTDKKVSIKNDSVSLLDLFNDLKTLIQNLKVTTPSGPSTGLLPDSNTSLNQFEDRLKQLLK